MTDREQLHRDGYALLRGAIPAEWLDDLRAAFDAVAKPSDQWPTPRGVNWRHSLVDLALDFNDESRSVQLSGSAGDILVFDADLAHAGLDERVERNDAQQHGEG